MTDQMKAMDQMSALLGRLFKCSVCGFRGETDVDQHINDAHDGDGQALSVTAQEVGVVLPDASTSDSCQSGAHIQ